MKKSLYISALILMLAGTSLTSCSDFLDADNKTTANKTADDYLILHPDEILNEAYASLYDFAATVAINEEGTDLYIPVRGKAASEFDQYTLNASNADVYSYYKALYTTINNANCVIHYNNQKLENKAWDAEAKFLRCWAYYLLTQQFGKVPYVTEYYKDYTTNFPRTELKTVYESCISELEDVYNKVNDGSVTLGSAVGAPSKLAFASLLAKFYLAKAWDCDVTAEGENVAPISGNENFAAAAKWAAIASGNTDGSDPKALTLDFAEKWSATNIHNAEYIWGVEYNKATGVAHSLQNDYGNYYGECKVTGNKNVGSTHAQSEKSLYLFAANDKRYEGTFMTTIYNFDRSTGWLQSGYYAAYNNPSYPKICYRYFPYYVTQSEAESELKADKAKYAYNTAEGNNASKAYILDANNSVRFDFSEDGSFEANPYTYATLSTQVAGGICVKKFDDANSEMVTSKGDYKSIPVFHTSDLYLTAAEAYYMAGNTDLAEKYVNAVRSRANAGDISLTDMSKYTNIYRYSAASGGFKAIDIILDERARECYAERTRWIDLRRTKQLVRYNKAYNKLLQGGTVKTLRPIPTNEMSNNSGIGGDQNPGY